MLNRKITVADALLSIEQSVHQLRQHVQAPQPPQPDHVMQLVPIGSYVYLSGSTTLGHVVSLAGVATPPWQTWSEHWFRNPGVDFAKEFDTGNSLQIVPDISSPTPTPSPALQAQMDALALTWTKDFQMYAIAELSPTDWSTTPPTLTGDLYYFAADGTAADRPRMVFEVDSKDGTKLNRIVWLSDTDQLSTYPYETLTLKYKSKGELPSATFYYTASR